MTRYFISPCKYCDNPSEFIVMLEDDDPNLHHTEYVCSECLNLDTVQAGLIESWTPSEWDD